jgi:hypothetical protein
MHRFLLLGVLRECIRTLSQGGNLQGMRTALISPRRRVQCFANGSLYHHMVQWCATLAPDLTNRVQTRHFDA